METLLGYLIATVVGFLFGMWLKEQIMIFNLLNNAEEIVESLEKVKKIREDYRAEIDSQTDGTELAIERVGNVLYAYNKENNQFVAQGTDLKSLLESAQTRFPDIKFFGTIPNGDSAKELAK